MPNRGLSSAGSSATCTRGRSSGRSDIAAVFTSGAEYHEWPYETDWSGRDEIVEGWQSRDDWQKNGWTFRGQQRGAVECRGQPRHDRQPLL
jgi:hypothetical protein